ncbi:MAG: DOPA 4,5-dioxygenase family protein [Hyphomicrobiales bacterium]|nr:DOPA 4,5-dioxygenase family protein [Hyphomicrobiales bacterium]
MTLITGYHARIHYNAGSKSRAQALSSIIEEKFGEAEFGRWHDRPVGPHPDWVQQISFAPELFDQTIPFRVLNRNGLIIFTHPNTDDPPHDHRDGAIWMGDTRPLNLKTLKKFIK